VPHELDPLELEALIAKAREPATQEEMKASVKLNEVELWCIALDIKEGGDRRYTPYHLWYEYKRWAKKPMAQLEFFKLLKRKFTKKKGMLAGHKSGTVFYAVYSEHFDNSVDTFDKVRESLKKDRVTRAKKRVASGQKD